MVVCFCVYRLCVTFGTFWPKTWTLSATYLRIQHLTDEVTSSFYILKKTFYYGDGIPNDRLRACSGCVIFPSSHLRQRRRWRSCGCPRLKHRAGTPSLFVNSSERKPVVTPKHIRLASIQKFSSCPMPKRRPSYLPSWAKLLGKMAVVGRWLLPTASRCWSTQNCLISAFSVLRYSTDAMAKAARPLVICGPSGVGKSTLIERMKEAFPDTFGFSVSHTTRGPRPGEKDGINYHYVTKEKFLEAKDRGEFIETAQFSGNMYGTSCKAVSDVQNAGQICILDIEMQGVKQLKSHEEIDPHYVFIRPPSMEELERRLRDRQTEQEEAIQKRLDTAQREMEYGSDPANFDIVIVNDDVDKASKQLNDFMVDKVEELRKIKVLMSKTWSLLASQFTFGVYALIICDHESHASNTKNQYLMWPRPPSTVSSSSDVFETKLPKFYQIACPTRNTKLSTRQLLLTFVTYLCTSMAFRWPLKAFSDRVWPQGSFSIKFRATVVSCGPNGKILQNLKWMHLWPPF